VPSLDTPAGERVSQCDVEVITPWRSLQSLTPDATQLADPGWAPPVLRQLQLQLQGEASSGAVAGEGTFW
jgi:DNA polymerase delta subunit 1